MPAKESQRSTPRVPKHRAEPPASHASGSPHPPLARVDGHRPVSPREDRSIRPAFQPTCGSNLVRADDWHLLNRPAIRQNRRRTRCRARAWAVVRTQVEGRVGVVATRRRVRQDINRHSLDSRSVGCDFPSRRGPLQGNSIAAAPLTAKNGEALGFAKPNLVVLPASRRTSGVVVHRI